MIIIEGDKARYSVLYRKEDVMVKNLRGGFGGILDSINYSAYHHRKAIKHLRTNKKA